MANKKYLFIAAILAVVLCTLLLFQVVCFFILNRLGGGTGDWAFDGLPGSYEIICASRYNIYVEASSQDRRYCAIEECVTGFCYNDRFIAVQQAYKWNGKTSLVENDLRYYIIDAETEEIKGPFSFSCFQKYCKENDMNFNMWIDTIPKPNGAK